MPVFSLPSKCSSPPRFFQAAIERRDWPAVRHEATAALALARSAGVPVRGHSAARHLAKFYGRWGGATHPEQIGVDGLLRLVDVGVGEGVTELSCHPGYVEPGFRSSYAAERELELRTLCDPRVRQAIRDRAIELIGFRDLLARAPRAAVPQAAP